MSPIPLLADNPAALDALSRVEIVYTDLDGTLLGRGGSLLVDAEGKPALQTARAVTQLNAAGLPVILTTGRNRIQCTEITRLLGWRGFLAELGCVMVTDRGSDPIYFTGDWPHDLLSPGETPYERLIAMGAVERLTHAFPGRLEPHSPYHLNREATVLLRGSLDIDEAQGILGGLEVPVDIVDNGIIHPRSTGLADVAEVHAYHLIPHGVTKSRAVTTDIVGRGRARGQAASIGDAVSDVAMADATAVGVLVANAAADARVREAAATRTNVYVTASERGEGWAEFADTWLAARIRAR
jgi:hypothetical protein